MKILALETSALVASVAITENQKLLGVFTINNKLTHSQTIMPMLDDLVKMVGIELSEIDYIACANGPGSFTGLRIGAATAKGLALGLNIPIVPIATLDALAYNVYDTGKIICPIMDARRNQVYTGLYQWVDGELTILKESEALILDDLIEVLLEYNREVIFVGDGVTVHKEKLEAYPQFKFAPPSCNIQSAAAVASIAIKHIENGQFVNGNEFAPVYLRKPQAEREREEQLLAEDKNV